MSASFHSPSFITSRRLDRNLDTRSETNDRDEGDHIELGAQTCSSQTKDLAYVNNSNSFYTRGPGVEQTCMTNEENDCTVCKDFDEPVYHVNQKQLQTLKNSTKKLLCLLEEVQAKTHSTALVNNTPKLSDALGSITEWDTTDDCDLMSLNVSDIIEADALKRLEKQTKNLDAIFIKDEDEDCSIHNRLTRKCHCLNQKKYNDFVIHFNEDTKYCTNTTGEIIKNMRIIKKFLYMGSSYTINALLFLNEGLDEGTRQEQEEIVQACAFADLCCIFEPHTIVTSCIAWPSRNSSNDDYELQELTARFLHKLASLDEGKRYLNFNSRIASDIKRVLKKQHDKISYDTTILLESVLTLCQNPNTTRYGRKCITYSCKPLEEDIGNKSLNTLIACHKFLTMDEVFLHLDILLSLAGNESTKLDLIPYLPSMISLFKEMLLKYNNSQMNIVITNILNNTVGNSADYAKYVEENDKNKAADIANEPVKVKTVITQTPVDKTVQKTIELALHRYRRPKSARPIKLIKNNPNKTREQVKTKASPINTDAKPISALNSIKTRATTILNAIPLRKANMCNVRDTFRSSPNVNRSKRWRESSLPHFKNNMSKNRTLGTVPANIKKIKGSGMGNSVIIVPIEDECEN